MVAGKFDIQIEKGETYNRVFTYKVSGVAVDISSYTARVTLRESHGGTEILSLTTENNRITVNSSGEITLILSAAETEAITQVTGVYDMELLPPANTVIKLLKGTVTFYKEVTT